MPPVAAHPSISFFSPRNFSGVWRCGLVLLGLLIGMVNRLPAQPTGGTVVSGSATITAGVNATTITAGNNSMLRWSSFNVGAGQTVQFIQPSATSRVLNWIGGQSPSQINGSLLANGQVYLLNPSGIYFGQSSLVDVGHLYAVGGSLSKEDFLAGLNRFTGLTGTVSNAGSIRGNVVALVGRSVANTGTIVSPNGFVGLAAGNQVLLGQDGSSIYVDTGSTSSIPTAPTSTGVSNTGSIDAGRGTAVLAAGDFYSIAITHEGKLAAHNVKLQGQGSGNVLVSGTIDASSTQAGETGGRVEITGEHVGLLSGASVNASGPGGGGTIVVGGDLHGKNADVRDATATWIADTATLRADATVAGNGGRVIVWADETNRTFGNVSARGAGEFGSGGFAEISGKNLLDFRGTIDLSAASGHVGTLLLDPTNIFIAVDQGTATGAGMTGTDTSAGAGAPNFSASGAVQDSLLLTSTLQLALASADVTIVTTNASGTGAGNIAFVSPVSWNSGYSLTATADAAITVNAGAPITNSGTGGLTLNAGAGGTVTLNDAISLSGGAFSASGLGFTTAGAGTIATNGGAITIAPTGPISMGTLVSSAATGSSPGDAGVGGNITISGGAFSLSGSLSSNGTGQAGGAANVAGGAGTGGDITINTASITLLTGSSLTANGTGAQGGTGAASGTGPAGGLGTGGQVSLTSAGGLSFASTAEVHADASGGGGGTGGDGSSGNNPGGNGGNGGKAVAGDIAFATATGSMNGSVFANATFGGAGAGGIGAGSGANGSLGNSGAAPTLGTITINNSGTVTAAGDSVQGASLVLQGAGNLGSAGSRFATSTPSIVFSKSGGTAGISSGAVSLAGTGSGGASLDLAASGGISQSGSLVVPGTLTVSASAGNIALTNAGNNFGTAAFTTASGDAVIEDSNGVVLGASSVAGDLSVTAGGNISQSAAVNVTGSTTLAVTAPNADILLGSQANNFGPGAIILGGTPANIRDLGLRTTNGSATLPDFSGLTSLRNLTLIFNSTGFDFDTAVTLHGSGNLSVTGGGDITESTGSLAVPGTSSFTATSGGGHAISLAQPTNAFTGAVSFSTGGAHNVSLNNGANSLVLGASSVGTGSFAMTGADITQTGAITQQAGAGSATFNAGANPITLTQGNDFTGAVSLNNSGAHNVAVTDVNALALGTSAVGSGTLTVNSVGLTQTGAIAQSGAGAVSLNSGAGAIALPLANGFLGAVSLNNSGSNNVTLTNGGTALVLGGSSIGSGALTITAPGITQTGAITQQAGAGTATFNGGTNAIILTQNNNLTGVVSLNNSGANNVALVDQGGVALGASNLGNGTLAVTAVSGGISETGAITKTGGTSTFTIDTGVNQDIQLQTQANNFGGGAVGFATTNGGSIRDLGLRDDSILASLASLPTNLRNVDFVFSNAGIALPGFVLSGHLNVTTGGDITQLAPSTVAGAASFSTGSFAIALTQNNHFNGVVSLANLGASDVSFTNAGALVLGTVSMANAGGALTIVSDGAITQSGATTITSGTGNVSVNSGASGAAITLANANDFRGTVSLSNVGPNAISIKDVNALDLGNVSVGGAGTLTVVTDGAVTQHAGTGITSGNGVGASFNSGPTGSPIALTSTLNNFRGPVSLTSAGAGGNISLTDGAAHNLVLGNVVMGNAASTLTIVTDGSIAQSAGSSITSGTGLVSFDSGVNGNAITLTLANDFRGAVALKNVGPNAISIRDINSLTLDNVTMASSGGLLTVTANGAITQSAGTALTTGTGGASFDSGAAGSPITLTNATNDFRGAVALTSTGAAGNIAITNGAGVPLILGTVSMGNAASTLAVVSDGAISQAAATGITSGTGAVSFNSGTNGYGITLTSGTNDFRGPVSFANVGPNAISLTDVNAVSLGTSSIGSGALTINAVGITEVGAITQQAAAGPATFNAGAGAIALTQNNDFTGAVSLNTTGSVDASVTDSNAFSLGSSAVGRNLNVAAGGNITEANGAVVAIAGVATFNAGSNAITLGGGPGQTTNFGSLNLSGGTVTVSEDSATVLTGVSANALALVSAGSITDAPATTIAVTGLATLNAGANAITLGDNAADVTNFGTLNLTGGAITVTEDSATMLTGVNATTVNLTSAGAITAAPATTLAVSGLATFNAGANAVTLGGDPSGSANFGSLNLTGGAVTVTEDSATVLTGVSATTLNLTSAGAITDAPTTAIAVTGLATLNAGANAITLGDSAGDTTNFGTLNLTGGAATITEDSATVLTGVNATTLSLTSAGTITAAPATTLAVSGLAAFNAGSNAITLGGDPSGSANFGSLNVTGGAVTVTEDSSTVLAGSNTSALGLTSAGAITTGPGAILTVSGLATFNAGTNAITIGGAGDTVNFGSLNVIGTTVTVKEDSATVLTGVNANTFTLTSAGTITDAPATTIAVTGLATLNSGSSAITLGDNPADTTNFGTLNLTGGAVTVTEDSATLLTGVNAASLNLTAAGTITEAPATMLAVTGLAKLNAGANAITLGGDPTGSTNFGSLNLTGDVVTVTEDSATALTGVAANTLTLTSAGAITDAPSSIITVTGVATLTATGNDITLGDSSTDVTNFGSLNLTAANANVTQESAMVLNTVTTTGNLTVKAAGSVTDTGTLTVGGNLNVTSTGDVVLDSPTNTFTGSIALTVPASSNVTLVDTTAVVVPSLTVANLTITAGGSITDAPGTTLAVSGAANFSAGANAITLGDSPTDSTNFGTLNLTGGTVAVSEDSATILTGVSANTFTLNSSGSITDATGTTLAVSGLAKFNAGPSAITLGGDIGDSTNFGTLSLTGGAVTIAQNSSIVLSGNNSANSLTLTSSGTITTNATAILAVAGNASFNGTAITLGDQPGNTVNLGSLTFNSPGNVIVDEDSGTAFTGNSSAANLTLTSAGAITNSPGTGMMITGQTLFNAGSNDITLGNNSTDALNFAQLNLTGKIVDVAVASAVELTGVTATTFTLKANGAISDGPGSVVAVSGLATLNAGANVINVGTDSSQSTNFGTLNLTGGVVAVKENSATILTGVNAGSLALTSSGTITEAPGTTLAVTGLASFMAGTSDITLRDNAGGSTNFGSLNFQGGKVTVVEDSSMLLSGNNAAKSLSLTAVRAGTDDLAVPVLTNSPGMVLNVFETTTLKADSITLGNATTSPATINLGDPSYIGTVPDHYVNLSLVFTGATVDVTTNSFLRVQGTATTSLSLHGVGVDLAGITTPTLNVVSTGPLGITDSVPTNIIGSATFDANGANIILDDTQNDFNSVQLNGATIVLTDANAVALAAVLSSGPFSAVAGTQVIVNTALLGSSSISLTAVAGNVTINSPISSATGNITITAGTSVIQNPLNAALTSATGDIKITAGTDAQLSDLSTGGGSIIVNAVGGVHFTNALQLHGPLLVNAGASGVIFDQTLDGFGGGADVTINTAGDTHFSGALGSGSPLHDLTTDAGGTTFVDHNVTVTNQITFGDPVVLSAALTTIGAANAKFDDLLSGQPENTQNVIFNVSGDTIFSQPVTLASLVMNATGGNSRTLINGGSILTTGEQSYFGSVLLGGNTVLTASSLAFHGVLDSASDSATAVAGATVSGASTSSTLTAHVTGATLFGPVGQANSLGDVLVDGVGATTIDGNFTANSASFKQAVTFDNPTPTTISTVSDQTYAGTVSLGTDQTFISSNGGISLAFGAQGVGGASRALTLTALKGVVSSIGDLGAEDNRFTSVTAEGKRMVIGGDIWASGNIELGVAAGAGNDFLQFNSNNDARNTRLDSLTGEIILGSGATGLAPAKTESPLLASIYKSNTGDLYLFARKVTIQPFERMVVRGGSLVAIADGSTTDSIITLSNTAVANYLILVSSNALNLQNPNAGIVIRARDPAAIGVLDANGNLGTTADSPKDNGTDLIAGAVLFFNSTIALNGPVPTRALFAPSAVPGPLPAGSTGLFDYNKYTGNILGSGKGYVSILPPTSDTTKVPFVYVADLLVVNKYRFLLPDLIFLNLATANGFGTTDSFGYNNSFIAPAAFGPQQDIGQSTLTLFGSLTPIQGLVTTNASPRVVLDQPFTPNVPREDTDASPPDADLAAAVREQLQALGIYARRLKPEERASRERREGLFVAIPETPRPRESDYEVAEARVQDRAVREVLRSATSTGLIGQDRSKLDAVARALAASFEEFSKASPSGEALEFRSWLESSHSEDAQRVVVYINSLRETLKRIQLLGLTRQELEGSKAQIYGSVLRARLNVEPEFLRTLVEGTPTAARVSQLRPMWPALDGFGLAGQAHAMLP